MIWQMFQNDVIVEKYLRFKCYLWKQEYIQVQKHGITRKMKWIQKLFKWFDEGEIHLRDINQKCFHEFYTFSET